jgi:PiT family inorganic phosphate transporter
MWLRAQQRKVDHSNVNADWDDATNSVVPADPDDTPDTPTTPEKAAAAA